MLAYMELLNHTLIWIMLMLIFVNEMFFRYVSVHYENVMIIKLEFQCFNLEIGMRHSCETLKIFITSM